MTSTMRKEARAQSAARAPHEGRAPRRVFAN